MSGHNKWSKIKHKKEATDARKSKEFGKLARLLSVESKKVGGDTNAPALRAIIEKARSINMPNDNIDRAVKKGAGGDVGNMEEVVYEAYGPGGSALIITGLTDNRNRTSAKIKHLLSRLGASLAEQGAASWAFSRNGSGWEPQTTVEVGGVDGDRLSEIIDALEEHDDVQDVYTNAI